MRGIQKQLKAKIRESNEKYGKKLEQYQRVDRGEDDRKLQAKGGSDIWKPGQSK